jgi:cytoskeletal protein RodZ
MLRAAREAKNMSVVQAASEITLSRDQILQLEQGGERSFHTPAHKLLAVRKYAAALGLDYDTVVTHGLQDNPYVAADPIPHFLGAQRESDDPADLGLVAVNHVSHTRRKVLIGSVLTVLVATAYFKHSSQQAAAALQASNSAPDDVNASSPPALPDAGSTLSIQANEIVAPAAVEVKTVAVEVAAIAPPATTPPPVKPSVSADQTATTCASKSADPIPTWSPPYQRKSDTRLFIVSPRSSEICIVDATGKQNLVQLKSGAGQSISGKPPFTVHAKQLANLDIYMQGLRAKIPTDAVAMTFKPTQVPAPSSSATDTPTSSASAPE